MDYTKAKPENFYAIGVGPGSSDLLTFRAASLIESADVIIAPRSRKSDKSLALETVKHLISGQEVVDHVYAMNRNHTETVELWEQMAQLSIDRCSKGKSVVQITLGDPMIYSTSCYLLRLLKGRMDDEAIHVVPGISAFQAAAGKFAEALTIQEDRMMLMPATDLAQVEKAIDNCETLVLYKAGKKIEALAELLKAKGLLERTKLVCYAEQPGKEFMTSNILDAADGKHGYMTTVVVHVGRQEWK